MRQVQKLWLLPLFIAWVALSNCGAFSQNAKWVTGYHPTWWYGALPPSQIDFNSLTHIVLFSAQDASTSPPYFNVSGVDDGNNFEQIISLAHAKGVKVILSAVGGYGQTNMPKVAADPTMCQAFVTNSCAWAQSKGLDGIELDWEFPRAADKVGWNRLIRLFRIELDKWNPRGTLMTSMYYSIGGPNDGPYVLDSMMVFDQINPMTYTMWMGGGGGPYHAGYDTPVNLPTQYSGYVGYSLSNPASGGPLSFLQAGYPASKLGISISFEGTQFGGVSTMGPAYSSYAFCSSVTKTNSGYAPIPASGRQWDATAQAAYCISGGKVYSYQDTNSVKAITTWAKNNGFGGVMLYDIGCGYDLAAPVPDAMLKMASAVVRGTVAPQQLPSGTFSASPATLPSGGGSVTLSWTSQNASAASIDQAIGSVALSGTRTLNVTSTTTFHLTLSNSSGTVSYSATVSVSSPAPTGTFTASPASLPSGGGTVSLSWTSQNATSASINQGVGSVSVSGTRSVSVTSTKTFQLTLTGSGGTKTYTATVTVAAPAGSPTGTFSATPSSLPSGGGSVTLSWTSQNATSASIDQGIGSVPVSGSHTVNVTSTTTFDLALTNSTGTQTYSVTVTVSAPVGLPTGSLSADPVSLPSGGGTVTLSWTSSGATSASIDQGIGAVALQGSVTETLTATTVFTLTLANANGTSTYAVTVEVDNSSAPGETPKDFTLDQNYPNPFNPSTKISFSLPRDVDVRLAVYNLLGQEVSLLVSGYLLAGPHQVVFEVKSLPAGMYFYRFQADTFIAVRRMLYIK